MDLSTAVLWWEEWQLRILVLGSLFLQWLLFLSASLRKFAIPSWFRFIIWLAYNGSDTLVLYALATLFTRQRRQDCSSGQGNSILEVVWAPVLLMHLGGQDLITAYNIEDNELWTRHVIAAVSQITIAIYVFCKSWPGGDMWLLFAALLFFIPGILKCIEKPWALKCASINSLVSSSGPAPRRNTDRDGRISSLEDYMQKASAFARINPRCRAQEGDAVDLEADNHLPQAQREEDAVDLEADNHLPQAQREEDAVDLEADHQPRVHGEVAVGDLQPDHHPQTSSKWVGRLRQIQEKLIGELYQQRENKRSRLNGYKVDREAYKLFLDLASPYPDRLGILKSIWVLDEKQASVLLQNRLFGAFDLLYTKRKMVRVWDEGRKEDPSVLKYLSFSVRGSAGYLPWVAIGLFHKSHRQAYNADDVKVTYAMFCCTAVLDFLNIMISLEDINSDSIERQYYTRALTQQAITKAITKAMQWLRVKKLVALCEQGKATSFQWLRTIQPKWAKKFDFMINAGLLDDILRRAVSDKVLINSFLGQYSLVGFFSRNKRHSKKMCIVNLLNCKDFLDQHWSMKPCKSSFAVTELVLKYVKKGWEDHIEDVASYWKFSDRRGQWTLQSNNCDPDLSCSLRKPFDESVLLWHIATDFCSYYMGASADHQCATAQCIQDASGQGHGCAVWCERSPHHKRAVQCREISNYMMYLLFVNPEMLLPGTRRNLFTAANSELKKILKDDNPSLKKILKGDKPSLMEILKCNKPFCKFFTVKRPSLKEIERGFTQRIIARVQPTENREQVVEHTELPLDAETDATAQEGFVHDAWNLANGLLQMRDEKKMWEVIEGVWVEMLCFSASRCRGYLHAKSLGTGPELLTYVWLLLSHMGMETLPERLQRTEFSCGEGNASATPSTSQIEIGYPARFRGLRPHEESATSAAGTSTSGSQEIVPAE